MAAKKKTEEKKVSANKTSSFDIAKKSVLKKYGTILKTMAEKEQESIETISSGSLGLDAALGRGGFALGRIYELYGQPSSGKSTLAMSVIAEAQKVGKNCVFVDAERGADPELFKAMGVDNSQLTVLEGFSGDENLDALEVLIKTGEVDVAVVDSVSSLIPKAEADAQMDDQFMGLLARLMSKAMRKFVPIIGRTNSLLIFINQVRNKIGVYGDPETTTGGVALDFNATGRIKVSGGDTKSSLIKDDITGEIVGHYTTFFIKKNKLAKPFTSHKVPLIYGVGYDKRWELMNLAVDLGVLERAGAWFRYKGNSVAQGEKNMLELINSDPAVHDELYTQVKELLGL